MSKSRIRKKTSEKNRKLRSHTKHYEKPIEILQDIPEEEYPIVIKGTVKDIKIINSILNQKIPTTKETLNHTNENDHCETMIRGIKTLETAKKNLDIINNLVIELRNDEIITGKINLLIISKNQ